MSSKELKFLIEKILRLVITKLRTCSSFITVVCVCMCVCVCRMMKELELAELPPLVYQLLVLATRGHKTLVLDGIHLLFNHFDKTFVEAEEDEMEEDTE